MVSVSVADFVGIIGLWLAGWKRGVVLGLQTQKALREGRAFRFGCGGRI
jgi:hypothetical protein